MMSRITSTVRPARNMKDAVHLFNNRRTLMQMLKEVWARRYRMSFLTNAAIMLGVLYVLFPFDVITDLIPFFGWMDDGFVIFLVIKRLQKETQRFNRFKAMERKGF